MRNAIIERTTKETSIEAALCIDGGEIKVQTGLGFFDHMLNTLAFHAGWGLVLSARGDLEVDGHHLVEDCGIVLGQALSKALGDKAGITRFAHAYVPMDEALGFAAVDLSGRAFLVCDVPCPQEKIGDYDACLTEEFMRALSCNAGITLHLKAVYGSNGHHITEAVYKALARALREAVKVAGKEICSTKGVF